MLLAANRDLPRHFDRRTPSDRSALAFQTSGPRIDFPLDGSTVDLIDGGGRIENLPLQADGGHRPLRWLVNGRPIPTALLGRGASWAPDGPGQVSIVVVDADGRAANATVWIE